MLSVLQKYSTYALSLPFKWASTQKPTHFKLNSSEHFTRVLEFGLFWDLYLHSSQKLSHFLYSKNEVTLEISNKSCCFIFLKVWKAPKYSSVWLTAVADGKSCEKRLRTKRNAWRESVIFYVARASTQREITWNNLKRSHIKSFAWLFFWTRDAFQPFKWSVLRADVCDFRRMLWEYESVVVRYEMYNKIFIYMYVYCFKWV